jgi:hypothetical protein
MVFARADFVNVWRDAQGKISKAVRKLFPLDTTARRVPGTPTPSPIRWENRRRTLRMFLHEFRTPGEIILLYIVRRGDRIRHEFHHCPLSLRLAHHGAVLLYLVRAIFFGGGHSGNQSPIAASSNVDPGKDNLCVPPLRKLLHRLTRAKPIQNRAAQRRSCGRRLNGIFAEGIRGHDERQDKIKLFHLRYVISN